MRPDEKAVLSLFRAALGFSETELALNRPYPWVLKSEEVATPGEIVVAEEWRPGWGKELRGNLHFRLVFLTRSQPLTEESLAEGRILVCLPGALGEQWLKEEGVTYGEKGAKPKPLREMASLYRTGRWLSQTPFPLEPATVFSTWDPNKSLPLLVSCLLSLPYVKSIGPGDDLSKALDQLRQELGTVRDLLAPVGWENLLEEPWRKKLERLSLLTESQDYLSFYAQVRRYYSLPRELREEVAFLRSLLRDATLVREIVATKTYLYGMVLRPQDEELAVDRVSLLEQMKLGHLVSHPNLWASVRALFDWFKTRYRAAYVAHHQRYYQEAASLREKLLQAEPRLRALGRLNSLEELGAPLGVELFSRYQELLAQVRPCPVKGDEGLALGSQPTCPACGLTLAQEPPAPKVERFLSQLETALREQRLRLSSQAIRQILSRRQEGRLEQFLQVVQASDLSALVDLLDDKLVAFLRELLRESRLVTISQPLWRQWREKYPVLEADQVDAALAELASLIREAFAQAEAEHPGQRVQLDLEAPLEPEGAPEP